MITHSSSVALKFEGTGTHRVAQPDPVRDSAVRAIMLDTKSCTRYPAVLLYWLGHSLYKDHHVVLGPEHKPGRCTSCTIFENSEAE